VFFTEFGSAEKSPQVLNKFWAERSCSREIESARASGGDHNMHFKRRSNTGFLGIVVVVLLAVPAAYSQTPAALFGMDIHSNVLTTEPWPSVPVGSIRLWDSHTKWSDLEPSRGVYAWANLDGYLALAQTHRVDVLFTFGGTAAWAASSLGTNCTFGPGSCFPPSNIQDWDDFVTAVVAHAAGRIKYWELWNEANYRGFWQGDMATLVLMGQHAYKIIKAADPSAVVLCPSSTLTPADIGKFLDNYFSAGGLSVTDIVAFHGYVHYDRPSAPEGILEYVNAVKTAMAAHGIAEKPIWDTEGSWGLNKNLSMPVDGPGYLARQFLLQWSAGVARFYWYAWNNKSVGTLWSITGIESPGVAYGQLYDWIVGSTLTSPCTAASDSTWTCGLTRSDGDQALIVWNSATTKSYTPATQYAQYVDLAGNTHAVNGSVTIGSSPILLVTREQERLAPPTNLKIIVN